MTGEYCPKPRGLTSPTLALTPAVERDRERERRTLRKPRDEVAVSEESNCLHRKCDCFQLLFKLSPRMFRQVSSGKCLCCPLCRSCWGWREMLMSPFWRRGGSASSRWVGRWALGRTPCTLALLFSATVMSIYGHFRICPFPPKVKV